MADTVELKGIERCRRGRDSSGDSLVEVWQVKYDSQPATARLALLRAEAAGLPKQNDIYTGTSLYFAGSEGRPTDETRKVFIFTVSWEPLPGGSGPGSSDPNPLLRPAEYDLQRRETDFPILFGYNVEELARADGGSTRSALTYGRIVNGAGEQPDEQPLDTISNPVFIIKKNYATLGEIAAINNDYQLTTNDAGIQGIDAERMKFLACESLGRQEENGIVYYPGVTSIEVMKTTRLALDNTGFNCWKDGGSGYKLTRAMVTDDSDEDNRVPAASPINLNLDGTEGSDDSPNSINWIYLEKVDYSPLF